MRINWWFVIFCSVLTFSEAAPHSHLRKLLRRAQVLEEAPPASTVIPGFNQEYIYSFVPDAFAVHNPVCSPSLYKAGFRDYLDPSKYNPDRQSQSQITCGCICDSSIDQGCLACDVDATLTFSVKTLDFRCERKLDDKVQREEKSYVLPCPGDSTAEFDSTTKVMRCLKTCDSATESQRTTCGVSGSIIHDSNACGIHPVKTTGLLLSDDIEYIVTHTLACVLPTSYSDQITVSDLETVNEGTSIRCKYKITQTEKGGTELLPAQCKPGSTAVTHLGRIFCWIPQKCPTATEGVEVFPMMFLQSGCSAQDDNRWEHLVSSVSYDLSTWDSIKTVAEKNKLFKKSMTDLDKSSLSEDKKFILTQYLLRPFRNALRRQIHSFIDCASFFYRYTECRDITKVVLAVKDDPFQKSRAMERFDASLCHQSAFNIGKGPTVTGVFNYEENLRKGSSPKVLFDRKLVTYSAVREFMKPEHDMGDYSKCMALIDGEATAEKADDDDVDSGIELGIEGAIDEGDEDEGEGDEGDEGDESEVRPGLEEEDEKVLAVTKLKKLRKLRVGAMMDSRIKWRGEFSLPDELKYADFLTTTFEKLLPSRAKSSRIWKYLYCESSSLTRECVSEALSRTRAKIADEGKATVVCPSLYSRVVEEAHIKGSDWLRLDNCRVKNSHLWSKMADETVKSLSDLTSNPNVISLVDGLEKVSQSFRKP